MDLFWKTTLSLTFQTFSFFSVSGEETDDVGLGRGLKDEKELSI